MHNERIFQQFSALYTNVGQAANKANEVIQINILSIKIGFNLLNNGQNQHDVRHLFVDRFKA